MENANTCTQLESYLHSINKLIKECYLDMANIRSFGRYCVGTQVKASYLERELGSMTYIKEQWAMYSEYEEPFRLSMARGCLMTSARSFFEYYEEHSEELDSLFRQKDLVKEYEEIGHAYDSYEASFAEIITPGGYKRLAAKLKELHSYFENYGSGNLISNCKELQDIAEEQQLKPVGEDQDRTEEQQVKQEPELLPAGEYFTADFLSHLYDAIKVYLSEEYTEFSWACIWNLVKVEGVIKFKKQRGPKGGGSAQLYYLIYNLTEYLKGSKIMGEFATQWEFSIVSSMSIDMHIYRKARTKCRNPVEQMDKPSYADFADTIEEFFKTYANNSK